MSDIFPAGKGGGPTPFVNAFDHPQINSLRYNTSHAGSPVHLCFGTQRVTVNVVEFWGFDSGSAGKGGKGLGGSGGKKGDGNPQYQVNVAFAVCQGPVFFAGAQYGSGGDNRIWANGGIGYGLGAHGLNGYGGDDGQSPDPVFASTETNQPVVGYSGTCYVTGTPLQLGSSPALPNVSFEITGFAAGSCGTDFPDDARPDHIVTGLLTDTRYGAGFPIGNLDISGSIADWGFYCQAAGLAMSLLLDKQQPCARWVEEIAQLTVAAVLWSGNALKIIPFGDQALNGHGASWSPNLTWQYWLTDADFLRSGDSDPVQVVRADPAQATNWLSVEYMDSLNSYNPQVVPAFDQALIDRYGLRSEPPIQAHEFTNPTSATAAAQLLLQRRAYIRNTYRFRLGWKYALLEPMDIVLLTDTALGLDGAAVRIIAIAEDDNGELSVTAEEIPGVTP